jgi:hypothetical protein
VALTTLVTLTAVKNSSTSPVSNIPPGAAVHTIRRVSLAPRAIIQPVSIAA